MQALFRFFAREKWRQVRTNRRFFQEFRRIERTRNRSGLQPVKLCRKLAAKLQQVVELGITGRDRWWIGLNLAAHIRLQILDRPAQGLTCIALAHFLILRLIAPWRQAPPVHHPVALVGENARDLFFRQPEAAQHLPPQ